MCAGERERAHSSVMASTGISGQWHKRESHSAHHPLRHRFQQRLGPLGVMVAEMTGDMSLSKKELEQAGAPVCAELSGLPDSPPQHAKLIPGVWDIQRAFVH